MPKQGKRSTKSNAKRNKVPPRQQAYNGTLKVTRTSTDMVAKAPPGAIMRTHYNRVRFG